MMQGRALLTLYGAPDCRRRYAEGPGDAPLADSAGHHLDDRGLLLLRTTGEEHPVSCRPSSSSPNPPWCGVGWTQVPGRTPRRRSRPRTSAGRRHSSHWTQGPTAEPSPTDSWRCAALRTAPAAPRGNDGCGPASPCGQTAERSERESPRTPARKPTHPLSGLTCPSLPGILSSQPPS